MSWLYFAVSIWGAWFTWNALHPIREHPRMASLSFVAGWLTSELPLHHIAWQLLATLVFASAGAFEAWPGRLGLLLSFASWAGLVAVFQRAHEAEPAVERALREGLGEDYASELGSARGEQGLGTVDWMRVLRPFPIRRPEVEVHKDILFARERGIDLQLDVYRNRARASAAPVLLQIHGGAWILGSKNEQALPLINQLAFDGWVSVSTSYRLSPHATFPDHIVDCKRALAWIREHIADYGGDPDFVVVTGGSAGGHLAALLALTPNDPEYQPGFEAVDTRVRACVPFYGVMDFADRNGVYPNDGLRALLEKKVMKGSREEIPEDWDRASPIMRVRSDAPPFFVVHGDSDSLVPVEDARQFVRALREKAESPVAYAEIPGAQHAFEMFPSLRSLHVVNGVHRFLTWLLRERGAESA